MVIIGICGFIGVGKDTFADYLVSEYEFKKFSFASATKDVLAVMFGWDRSMLEGDTIESRKFRETIDHWWALKLSISDFTPRKALQMIGTDLFRKYFNYDIWTHIIENKIISNKNSNIIISDCRFPNEIAMIKNLGAKIIHIQRNIPLWFESYKSGKDCDEVLELHLSETAWIREHFDYQIINDTNSKDRFNDKIINFLQDNFDISK